MVPEIIDMDMPVEGVFHNLVITKIKKEYAGQGQKVMNAMWGAGQMMFNKILVLADEGTIIQNYEQLAKYVFNNLNPTTDIYFSQGPMDVLDHSCSKLGFGGKMCIDGTKKFDEEISENFQMAVGNWQSGTKELSEELKNSFNEIAEVNIDLLQKDIPCILLSVQKNRIGHIKELHNQICKSVADVKKIKMILYVEHTVDPNDLTTALWRFCNNLDPKRDYILSDSINVIGFDGTRKTKELDNFQRDWPNIIVADNDTIKSVDEKWDKLNAGKFIASPSLKFKNQLYGEEAAVN
jgi:4-hydroxy-3-polyprenylbenzoate decarboxylase